MEFFTSTINLPHSIIFLTYNNNMPSNILMLSDIHLTARYRQNNHIFTWDETLTVAPFCTRTLTMSSCPANDAMCSAVFPFCCMVKQANTIEHRDVTFTKEIHVRVKVLNNTQCSKNQWQCIASILTWNHNNSYGLAYTLASSIACIYGTKLIQIHHHQVVSKMYVSECLWTEMPNWRILHTFVAPSTRAPRSSSSVTMFICPSLDARCNAFRPFCPYNTGNQLN